MENVLIKNIKLVKGVRDVRIEVTMRNVGVKSSWSKDTKIFYTLIDALDYIKSIITSSNVSFLPFTRCSRIVKSSSYSLDDKAYYIILNTRRGIRKYYLVKDRELLTHKVSYTNATGLVVSYNKVLLDNPIPSDALFTKEELEDIPQSIKEGMRVLVNV